MLISVVYKFIPQLPNLQKLCSRLMYGAINCVKRFGIGLAAAVIGTPLTIGIVKIAQISGFVPDIDQEMIGKLKPMMTNLVGLAVIGLIVPIIEEIFFRGIVQDVLLTRIPKYLVKKTLLGKEIVFDTLIIKTFRIILTASLFAVAHTFNDGTFPDSYVKIQLVAAFVGGIGLGVLKESRFGLLSAIGAHSANNFGAMAYTLYVC